jgi:hypothetical protein
MGAHTPQAVFAAIQRPARLALVPLLLLAAMVAAVFPAAPAGADPTLSTPPNAPAQAALPWLHAEGNRLLDERGFPVRLRGVNIESREWQWYSRPNIDFERWAIPLATGKTGEGWGANIVTLAVASGPINRGDALYLSQLDELVAMASANGAYTMLAYRYAEPNTEQARMPDQAAEDAMAALALRYQNEPGVLYALQVEPRDTPWRTLKPRFTTMIDAIRAHSPRALVAVPGTQWGRYVDWALDDAVERPNLIYKTHTYDSFDEIMSRYRLPELAARYPVIIGEFGAGSFTSQADVDRLIDMAEAHGMHWVAWLFHERACPCLFADAETATPSRFGIGIRDRLRWGGVLP